MVMEIFASVIKQEKKKRKTYKLERKKQNALFAYEMIVYIENHKECATKPLELISEFGQISIQKPTTFLYTNDAHVEI